MELTVIFINWRKNNKCKTGYEKSREVMGPWLIPRVIFNWKRKPFHNFLSYSMPNSKVISEEELRELLGFQCVAEDRAMLAKEVTREEVKQVLFAMPGNKSPGPEVIHVNCTFTWDIVGKDYVMAIKSFFDKGFLPKGLNANILALIPKKSEPHKMKDYHPISCCNVIYKIISKILASRLK